jgi:hypothetical protein
MATAMLCLAERIYRVGLPPGWHFLNVDEPTAPDDCAEGRVGAVKPRLLRDQPSYVLDIEIAERTT